MKEQFSAWAGRLSTARGRSALAAVLGVTAMLLILLSELRSGSGAETPAASAPDAAVYQTQLEQRCRSKGPRTGRLMPTCASTASARSEEHTSELQSR